MTDDDDKNLDKTLNRLMIGRVILPWLALGESF